MKIPRRQVVILPTVATNTELQWTLFEVMRAAPSGEAYMLSPICSHVMKTALVNAAEHLGATLLEAEWIDQPLPHSDSSGASAPIARIVN